MSLELIIEINKEYTHIHRKGILKMEKRTQETPEARKDKEIRDNEMQVLKEGDLHEYILI